VHGMHTLSGQLENRLECGQINSQLVAIEKTGATIDQRIIIS
jgi:hypothetical protein